MEALLWQLPSSKVSFVKCSATVLARSLIGYQVQLQVTKSLNACVMFASLLNVILLFITVVVVCCLGLPTYPNPNLGETSLHRSSRGWTTRDKPRLQWNRGIQPRKTTSDVYLGKRLSCYTSTGSSNSPSNGHSVRKDGIFAQSTTCMKLNATQMN